MFFPIFTLEFIFGFRQIFFLNRIPNVLVSLLSFLKGLNSEGSAAPGNHLKIHSGGPKPDSSKKSIRNSIIFQWILPEIFPGFPLWILSGISPRITHNNMQYEILLRIPSDFSRDSFPFQDCPTDFRLP